MSKGIIFQVSDLAKKRTEFVRAAREEGAAHVRDTDGTSFVMLRERRVDSLEKLAAWSGRLLRLQALVNRDKSPSITELGELAWLRAFDMEDLREFVNDLNQVLIASLSDEDTAVLDEAIHAWQVTAKQLEDPLRRAVLMGENSTSDFVDAERPDGE